MSAAQAKKEQRWQAALARPACSRCLYCRPDYPYSPAAVITSENSRLHCTVGKFVTHAMAVCGSFVQRTS